MDKPGILEILANVFSPSLFYASLRASAPVMYAGLCAAMTQQAGILNLGTEGIMLMGAYLAVAFGYLSGSWLVGIFAAMLGGAIIAGILGVGNLRYQAFLPAICIGMNLFVLGFTRFLLETNFKVTGVFVDPRIPPIPRIRFDGIPFLGAFFNNWCLTEWLLILIVPLTWFVIFKTTWGLRIRSVGKMEMAARTAGLNVNAYKYQAILVSGLLGGLAGAHLSLGYSNMFVQGMTNNRGFMGIAAMWFGNAHPVYTVIGAYIFGFFDSTGSRLQPYGFPSQFVLAIPYIVTVVILALVMLVQARREKRRKSPLSG
ncbi:MAG: ABC transporter permease [Treponema sp.]|jgi:simple sugar transport system permease protein|nr:ABC transporter permease [Treponema sp.]